MDPPSDWESLREQLFQLAAVVAVAATVAFLGITIIEWQKRQFLPFCDSFSEDDADSCFPCPENGKCWDGQLECLPGFRRHGKACVRDPQTGRAVQLIADFIMQQVCGNYSGLSCKWTGPEGLSIDDVTQLVEQVGLEKLLNVDSTRFGLALAEAIEAAKNVLITKTSLHGVQELQCPIELRERYKPYWCRIQTWLFANCTSVLIFVPVILLMAKMTMGIYHRRKISTRSEQLYLQVCELLEEKAQQTMPGEETWVVVSYLRDHLLGPRERKNNAAWLMVEQMVNKDSRIDQYPKLIKGESKVVWEWQVKGALKSPVSRRI